MESQEALREMSYQSYLQSKWWQFRRKWAISDFDNKCQRCGFTHQLDAHHLSYENIGDERAEDLMVLCRRCHLDEHYFAGRRDITRKEALKITVITENDCGKAKEKFE